MNKVFKTIWSKVRGMYVVVPELAKSHTKAPKSGVIGKSVIAGILACIISCGAVVPVFASGTDSGIVTSTDGVAYGTIPITTGKGSIAIGTHAVATGNNLSWEDLNQLLADYNIKKGAADDLSTLVANDVSDRNAAKDAFDEASVAAAAVTAAQQAQAGYQTQLDDYMGQKPGVDDAYTTAKTDYETLLADFQGRLERIKYIDFSLYADGSAVGYDIDRMATNLKSDTEQGTTFNMPVSFYKDFIQNYIKAEGGLRKNLILSTNIKYVRNSSFGTFNPDTDPKFIAEATSDGQYLKIGNSGSGKYDEYGFNSDNKYVKNFFDTFDVPVNFSLKYIVKDSSGYRVSERDITDSLFSMNDFCSMFFTGSARGNEDATVNYFKSMLQTEAISNETRNAYYSMFDSVCDSKKAYVNDFCQALISTGQYSPENASTYKSFMYSKLDKDVETLKRCADVSYYQYMYEQTNNLSYLSQKEQALLVIKNNIDNKLGFITNQSPFKPSEINGYLHSYAILENAPEDVVLSSPYYSIVKYLYDNVTAVQDATVVALKEVTDGLEGQIAEKKQAYDDAAAAKKEIDDKIADLTKKISDLEPSDEDKAKARELEQKRQDLQDAEDKLAADEAALQQAYQDMLAAQVGEIGQGAIAIGDNAVTTGKNAIGVGSNVIVTGEEAVAVGSGTIVSGKQSIGIGANNSISEDNSIAIGANNGITGANSIAIGNSNIISGSNSVAIGNNMKVTESNVVSFGKRKGIDLKAGTLSKTSTEAVIGSQLWTTNQNLAGMKTDINTNKTNIASLNDSVTNTLESVSTMNTLVNTMDNLKADVSLNNLTNAGKQVIAAAAVNAVQEYMAGSNKVVLSKMASPVVMNAIIPDDASPANGGEVYEAIENAKTELQGNIDTKADITYVDDGLAAKADLSYVDEQLATKADADNVYTKDEADTLLADKADITYVDDELSKKADKEEVESKAEADASNIEVDAWSEKLGTGTIEDGNTGLVNGGAVYKALKDVSGNDVVKAGDNVIEIGGSAKYDAIDSVSIAKSDGTGRVLRGVIVDPADDTSAANVGYVNAVGENIMNRVNNQFGRLDDRISKVGANAAAMAALTPAPSEGNEKWSLSAAVGNYSDATAGAVGLFYRPSGKVMINVRGTVGSDRNMVGAGVSVNLDKGDKTGVTKEKLVQVVNAQAERIEKLEAMVAEMAKKQ